MRGKGANHLSRYRSVGCSAARTPQEVSLRGRSSFTPEAVYSLHLLPSLPGRPPLRRMHEFAWSHPPPGNLQPLSSDLLTSCFSTRVARALRLWSGTQYSFPPSALAEVRRESHGLERGAWRRAARQPEELRCIT